MKKVLVLLVVLGLVAPAMAVTLTGAQVGTTNVGAIGYSDNGQAAKPDPTRVSGFALKITVDNGAVITACTRAAENANGANYGIFPGNINLANPASPVYNDAVEPDNLNGVGGASAIGTGQVIIAMGALHTSAPLPPASGQLVNITVSKTCIVTVQSDSARGGVVGEDAQTMTVSTITFPMTLESAPLAPTGVTAADGGAATTIAVSWTASAGATSYDVYKSFTNNSATATLAGNIAASPYSYSAGASAAAAHGETTYFWVKAKNAAGDSPFSTGDAGWIDEAMKNPTVPAAWRTAWVSWGRPDCWNFERQCRGDVNRQKVGLYWVQGNDLNIFKAAYQKQDAALAGVANGICADLDKTKVGLYRVQGNDLTTFKLYYQKQEAVATACPMTNHNFWKTTPHL